MPAATAAQIATDGTVGAAVELSGADVRIDAELGRRSGGNLLHSFERFNVNGGQSATFEGPAGIDNLIARVTGGQSSRIDGLLRSTVPGADVFLVNPAGITFGPNGAIDVPGSFHASTAERLVFSDGSSIGTDPTQAVTLTTAPVAAFGFLGGTGGRITLDSRDNAGLTVGDGGTLALVGGAIATDGAAMGVLQANGGTVSLVAATGIGEVATDGRGGLGEGLVGGPVDLVYDRSDPSRTLDANIALDGGTLRIAGGDISLDQVRVVGFDGFDAEITGDRFAMSGERFLVEQGPGDDNVIRIGVSGEIVFDRAAIRGEFREGGFTLPSVELAAGGDIRLLNGARIQAASNRDQGDAPAPDVTLLAGGDVVIDGSTEIDGSLRTSGIVTGADGAAPAGDIRVEGRRIVLSNGALLSALTSTGIGGDISLVGRETISVTAGDDFTIPAGTLVQTAAYGANRGGDLTISTPNLRIERSFVGTKTYGAGDGGSLAVSADSISLRNGGRLIALTQAPGRGGDVVVNADALTIQAIGDPFIQSVTGIATPTLGLYGGPAGSTMIDVGGRIDMIGRQPIDGYSQVSPYAYDAVISGRSFSNSPGGDISITAQDLSLRDGAQIFTTTLAGGAGGEIDIVVRGRLELTTSAPGRANVDESSIQTTTLGFGRGGDIDIVADEVFVDRGFIGNDTRSSGDGGNLRLTADTIEFRNEGRIFAGTSPAGDAQYRPPNSGNGGRVDVIANVMTIDATLDHPANFHTGISSSAEIGSLGAAGDVAVIVRDRLTMRQSEALINAETKNARPGGSVTVIGGTIRVEDDAEIGATGEAGGAAGNVDIFAERLDVRNAGIRTSGQGAEGGRVDITARTIIALDNGEITSSGIRPAQGASIVRIEAPAIVLENGSRVLSLLGDTPTVPGGIESGEAAVIGVITRISDDSQIAAATSAEITGLDADVGNDLQVADPVIGTSRDLLAGGCGVGGEQAPSTFLAGGGRQFASPAGFLGVGDADSDAADCADDRALP